MTHSPVNTIWDKYPLKTLKILFQYIFVIGLICECIIDLNHLYHFFDTALKILPHGVVTAVKNAVHHTSEPEEHHSTVKVIETIFHGCLAVFLGPGRIREIIHHKSIYKGLLFVVGVFGVVISVSVLNLDPIYPAYAWAIRLFIMLAYGALRIYFIGKAKEQSSRWLVRKTAGWLSTVAFALGTLWIALIFFFLIEWIDFIGIKDAFFIVVGSLFTH